jgi:hypothetical protein
MKRVNHILSILFASALLLSAYLPANGSTPRIQTFNAFADFERGTPKNLSILYDGKIALAPQTKRLMDTGDPFIWSIVTDKKENIYIATGNDGRVYRISAFGDSTLFFDAQELEVYALALDKQDNLYVGTSPNGKVYKVTAYGKTTVFFEPKEAYIWALAFDSLGYLYVATGEKGKIYRIKPDGSNSLLFESDQTHIRCLAVDKNNQLFAGSSGNGYVYRFFPAPKAFVLYDTQMEEVHSLAISAAGEIYAAAFGEVGRMPIPGMSRSGEKQFAAQGEDQQSKQASGEVTLSPQSIVPQTVVMPIRARTSLFRIDQNGYAKDLWTIPDESIQVIALDQNDNLIVGTSDHGKLYQMNRLGETSLLLRTEEPQITSLHFGRNGEMLIGTSNMARCYRIGPGRNTSGTFESETIDTGALSTWGVLSWEGKVSEGKMAFYTRAGNTERPEITWSPWAKAQEDGVLRIISPVARFLQWKCEFSAQGNANPSLDKLTITYLQNNWAPEITSVIIHRPGEYYDNKESSAANSSFGGKEGLLFPQQLNKGENRKGYRSVDWLFQDPNVDGLKFEVYYCAVQDKVWKPLAKDLEASVYSWDSTQMADGEYQIKVISSDAPSNPDNLALSSEKLSDPFIIDNTGPEISKILSQKNSQRLTATFTVTDKWNAISLVQYSINADGWKIIYPRDGICDSQNESFEISVPSSEKEKTYVAIKAMDSANNINSTQFFIKGSE